MVRFELVTDISEDAVTVLAGVEFSEKEWRVITRWVNTPDQGVPEVLADQPLRLTLRGLSQALMWMMDYANGTDRRQPRPVPPGPEGSADRHCYTGGMPPREVVLLSAQKLAALVCYIAQYSAATLTISPVQR